MSASKYLALSFVCAVSGGLASIANAASEARYHDELTLSAFVSVDAAESAAGRQLVDIEVRDAAGGPFFSGVWYPVDGTTWRWFHGDTTAWDDFLALVKTKQGRWLDVEVGIFDGQKRWSGIFLEDGDDYSWEIRSTNDDAGFQVELDDNFRAGRQIIDFEAYVEDGETKFGGVWVSDPNQPRTTLYYGLTGADVNDIFKPQLPIDPTSGISPIDGIAGRPIDFECYYSTLHGEYRYAVIMAMYPGHEWAVWFGQTKTDFDQKNNSESDDNTHLIDLEVYNVGGAVRYAGIWGDTYKSLHEVNAISADADSEPLNANLQNLVAQFEAQDAQGPLGIVGFYAKNIRSDQSVGYRAGEPFYLASCSKTPIHIRLWQMHEAGQIDILNDPPFTFTKNPWYVEDKSGGFDQFDFGNSFTWNTVDRYMIQASDNAATSIIMETVVGRERLNNWLAGVAGVGRGFGLITGITDLDRVVMWQGQVQDFPGEPSYFLIPSYIWEPTFRGMGDVFGDLQTWANANNGGNIPQRSDSLGHARYYRMGMNTTEPRAFGRLLEKYMAGDFFTDPVNTLPLSLANFGSGTQMVDNLDGTAAFPGFPPLPEPTSLTVYSKNGGKGGVLCNGTRYQVVNDTAIIQKGAETIVMGIFCRDNLTCNSNCVPAIPNCRPVTASPPGNAIRSFYHARFGYELFSQLIADLEDRGPTYHQTSSTTVSPNGYWWVACDVSNTRGGDALPYKIRFYASLDAAIKPSDYLIGTFQTPTRHLGNSHGHVVLAVDDFPPNIPFNKSYYVGWIIDEDDDVGEWDDRLADNTVLLGGPSNPVMIEVKLSLKAPDYDHDGDVNIDDLSAFEACGSGPGVPQTNSTCLDKDFDFDRDVDQADFGIFQRCLSGPRVLSDPECVEVRLPT